MSYTKTEEYQKEIEEQYQQRNLQLVTAEVVVILKQLGFTVSEAKIREAEAGNMNATFITSEFVVKISSDAASVKFLANKLISETLPDSNVVRVLHHDVRDKTDYEVLVMERAPGTPWLTVMPVMSREENTTLFSEVLDIVEVCRNITVTEKFGWVTDILSTPQSGFVSYRLQLESRLRVYEEKIRVMDYLNQSDVESIVSYAQNNLHLFEHDTPSFVHTDLHMGNVMQEIDNPAQFVEGTSDFEVYKDKRFEYLYPFLKQTFTEELADPELSKRLNVLGIIEGLMWVSEEWSKEWNKEMIHNLATVEVPEDGDVSGTYYGQVIKKIVE